MIKKHYYSWQDVEKYCTNIILQMYKDNWRPDYIVGITRGGNVPATILSNMLDIRCEALKVSLRDDKDGHGSESNCWMSEDAYGYYTPETSGEFVPGGHSIDRQKKILIVDDINDTGSTFNWIMQDWESGCMPHHLEVWEKVWGNNVRFATLTENLASEFDKVSYTCHEINKAEEDVWLVYPWENVG